MELRTVEQILEEWRAAERELETAPGTARLAIQARIDELREEHRVAIEDRASVAMELSQATRNSDAGYRPATGVLGGKTGVASLGVPDVGASEILCGRST